MPSELAAYITEYGYLAIFSLIFIQEMGFPNPVPNEFILLFGGYLCSIGVLSLPLAFLAAVSADCTGTAALYVIFYFLGGWILAKKPRWLPVSKEKVDQIAEKVSARGWWGVFGGRLIPYLRGYASVAAGVLRIKPKTYLTAVIASAVLWSGGYVVAGSLLGKYWHTITLTLGGVENLVVVLALIAAAYVLSRYIKRRRMRRREKEENGAVHRPPSA
jgi:membrane protein DedA with SNARE-associated domain